MPVSPKRPNILWLMSDQHNANCLGLAGHPDVRTLHLDEIAASGIRFDKAYCNNPICGPSRCSFLTGMFVKSHGVSGNCVRDYSGEAPNIARHFRDAGYQTALIGKAHLPSRWVIKEGFEHIRFSDLADADAEDPLTCHYFSHLVEAGLGDAYDHGVRQAGEPGYGLRSFISEIPEAHCLETWTGSEALAFLEGRDASRPFFLKVSFQRPHDPFAPRRSRRRRMILQHSPCRRVPVITLSGGLPANLRFSASMSMVNLAPAIRSAVRTRPRSSCRWPGISPSSR